MIRKYLFSLLFLVPHWASAQASALPQRGGVLKFAVVAEPANYDCHAQSSFSFIHTLRPHYSTLLEIDAAKYPAVKGDLAATWSISEDRLSYTFKLKPGVRFHDGATLTAEDVRISYDRIRNPPAGVVSVRAERYADIASIETPDPLTVVFNLSQPNNAMLLNFASPFDCIYSAARLKDNAKYPESNVLGTGPFAFEAHVAGAHWHGRRYAHYHEPGKPYLDGYAAEFLPRERMLKALASGDIHAEFRGLAAADRSQVTAALAARAAVQESPWLCTLVVTFNTAKQPFNSGRVRRALSLAIDRWDGAQSLSQASMVRQVSGLMRPGSSMALSEQELAAQPGFAKDIEASRAQARMLLQAAGVTDLAFTLTSRASETLYGPVGKYLVDQWRQIGVTVQHQQHPPRAFFESLQRDNPPYDAALDFACDHADDPNLQLARHLSYDRTGTNFSQHTDRTLDALYDRQSREPDRRKRYELVREFERRALRLAYSVPVLWWHRAVVMDRSVRGWHITPSHYLGQNLADVWLAR